jgi:hypothetical protein
MNPTKVGGVKLLFSDVRVALLVMGEVPGLVVGRVFGIPRKDQTFLVTVLTIGALAAILRDGVARLPFLRARPSIADAGMGAALVNATLRGIAGVPSREGPAAGGLIAFAVLAHSVRPLLRRVVAGSGRDINALVHGAEHRYGHSSALPAR